MGIFTKLPPRYWENWGNRGNGFAIRFGKWITSVNL